MLASLGRLEEVTQVIINPSDEAYFNVVSSMSKKEDVKVKQQACINALSRRVWVLSSGFNMFELMQPAGFSHKQRDCTV